MSLVARLSRENTLADGNVDETLESRARGLPKRSWIKISQIRTVAVERIGRRIAQAAPEELSTVLEGLGEIIGDS